MSQVKAVFYLPLRDNHGRDLFAEAEAVTDELYVRFAGWTFMGHVKGAYRMIDGSQSVDESSAYLVVLEETRLGELEQVLREFKEKTTQEAIYLEVQKDVEVRFIR